MISSKPSRTRATRPEVQQHSGAPRETGAFFALRINRHTLSYDGRIPDALYVLDRNNDE